VTRADGGQAATQTSPRAQDTATALPSVTHTPWPNLAQRTAVPSISTPRALTVPGQPVHPADLTGTPSAPRQWVSNFCERSNTVEGLLNNRSLGSTPRVSDSVSAMN